MNSKELGRVLYDLRKKNGLTQQQVADKLNLNRKSVAFWEEGRNVPKLAVFVQLCKIYNTTPNAIVSQVGDWSW